MIKKIALIITGLIITITAPAFAEMDHSMHDMGHKKDEMGKVHGMDMSSGMEMHSMTIDDYKLQFHIMDKKAFRNYMDNMGHKGHEMKEGMSHYVMMDISDPDGKKINSAKVKLKVIGPDKNADEKAAFPMMGNFGAEFHMMDKGKYQIMTLFKTGKDKHHGGFWHEMK